MTTVDISAYKLFTPLRLGPGLELKNRIVASPLIRGRADADGVPTKVNVEYYAQRADAGLIIAEGTAISAQAYGWNHGPAMFSDAHVAGWKRVVDGVHAGGGVIFLQLWHPGRQGHPSYNPEGEVVSASAIRNTVGHTRDANYEQVPYETPRALEVHEIRQIVRDFQHSSALARRAGFDGVEVHGANGYLLAQFLQSVTNKRAFEPSDPFNGSSFESRTQLLLEVVDAVKREWPAHRVGVRLSPNGWYGGMGSPDNFDAYSYALRRLRGSGIGYVALLDGAGFGYHDKGRLMTVLDAKRAFQGVVMASSSYTRDTAEGALRSGAADMVGFGRPFMANPDLVDRFRHNWPLSPTPDRSVFYGFTLGPKFYCDWPAYTAESGDQDEESVKPEGSEAP
jgi:N-ethylmaleimide reductase